MTKYESRRFRFPVVTKSLNTQNTPESSISCSTGDAFRHTQVEFQNFQIHFMERSFRGCGRLYQSAGQSEMPCSLEKFTRDSAGGDRIMHARPEVKRILISQKLLKWASIGKNPSAYPNCSPSRARRNYARLFARHEEVARRLGLTTISAYPRI